ncbi:MAG: hypothetical protein ABIO55_10050 [Ginsengibacter sp.]
MQKNFMLFIVVGILITSTILQTAVAQTWNLAGNNDATNLSKLGTTNLVPLRLFTNNTERLRIHESGNVGIGTTNPLNILNVKVGGGTPIASWLDGLNSPIFMGMADGVSSEFVLAGASNAPSRRAVFQGRRARGTLAVPLAVVNNDYLTSLLASGYDGGTFQNPATIDIFVDGIPSAGNVPARISFVTGSNVGNRQERLKVGSTGNFNFNNSQLTLTQATGDVGIGTGNLNFSSGLQTIQFPNPGGSSNAMLTMFTSGTQNNDRMVISHSPAYPNWGLQYSDPEDKFNFLSGGTPVLTADLGSQRVGIGTSSPAYKLDVAGRMRVQTGAGSAGIWFANGANTADVAFAGMANDRYVGFYGSGFGWGLAMNTTDGSIGIGTLTPAARVDVVGISGVTTPVFKATTTYVGNSDIRAIQTVSHPADGYGYGIQATGGYRGGAFTGDGGAYTGGVIGVLGTASGSAGTRYGVYGSASGGTENWGGYFPTKTYASELRVGGLAGASGYVAAINGKLIATEVRVELIGNWPDYVFKKGYALMPIEDLAAKISAENHLPGVPSAGEMKENGIMLGEMQTKTMEKVEENTLYIIELNNKIKLLEKKIDELTKERK